MNVLRLKHNLRSQVLTFPEIDECDTSTCSHSSQLMSVPVLWLVYIAGDRLGYGLQFRSHSHGS